MGMHSYFPMEGASLILGNDLAGGKVLVKLEVTAVPVVTDYPDSLARKYPAVFSACAVTRVM